MQLTINENHCFVNDIENIIYATLPQKIKIESQDYSVV